MVKRKMLREMTEVRALILTERDLLTASIVATRGILLKTAPKKECREKRLALATGVERKAILLGIALREMTLVSATDAVSLAI